MKMLLGVLVLLMPLVLGGCIKEDYSKVSQLVVWTPNYSAAVGAQTSTFPAPPLVAPPTSVSISDTISFSFADLFTHRELVESLMFRVNVANNYPAEVTISVDYFDASGIILGSFTKSSPFVMQKPWVEASSGKTATTWSERDIFLTNAEIDALQNAKWIIITSVLTNIELSDPLLTHWSDFSIKATVGLQAQMRKSSL